MREDGRFSSTHTPLIPPRINVLLEAVDPNSEDPPHSLPPSSVSPLQFPWIPLDPPSPPHLSSIQAVGGG